MINILYIQRNCNENEARIKTDIVLQNGAKYKQKL